ncbi:NUDIX domain-containing protein [Olleya sp. AH-315-F22]|nr:NUDIX domain-containing protein [Olleya sp. AH-315-F22]
MQEEYLDILDEVGKPTGKTCLKLEAHKRGYFHPTVHVWFYTKKGEILLQKRGSKKQTFPNFWDVSVAGHVLAGEAIEDAALREVKEEIGIEINKSQLTKIDVRKNVNLHPNGVKDCEFQHVFLVELNLPFGKLKMQKEEVDDLRLFLIKEIQFHLTHPESSINLVPINPSYYKFVIEAIIKKTA